ncbi:MAG: hypothetical protein LQ340_000392 [Diploschistes diacapsis]|nr:MAG: hypothetical protein LQ340_000392 [Diploschistes diacapsis]
MAASDRLAETENSANDDLRRSQRDSSAYRSNIYEPGAEFALCIAMSQLMGATVAVFRESLTDSLKGFYKLRKAYIALEGIVAAEKAYMEGNPNSSISIKVSRSSVPGTPLRQSTSAIRLAKSYPGTPIKSLHLEVDGKQTRVERHEDENEDEVDDFYDAEEVHRSKPEHLGYSGKVEVDGVVKQFEDQSIDQPTPHSPLLERVSSYFSVQTPKELAHLDLDALETPIDKFIHSGANLCYGILLLLLSLVPPAFSKLLSIIGFRGDRRRGLSMLWQASRFPNAMGAMASLVLLAHYNTLVATSDIVLDIDPDLPIDSPDSVDGYPTQRLESVLRDMQQRFPNSKLWLLEEARMHAANKDLDGSLQMLKGDFSGPLKQTKALAIFERSIQSMYTHDYFLCASSFQICCELNNWSHALYLYTAGAAYIELYRQIQPKDPKKAAEYGKKAQELFEESKGKVGKRRVMARQLPFDAFVARKLSKWEARAKEWDVPFIDAIGVSPLVEMIFFWNGFKKMTDNYLERALEVVQWSDDEKRNRTWSKESLDEHAILAVLRATIFRSLGHQQKAMNHLRSEILSHDKLQFKGGFKDDWTCPAAHYEMAANLWALRDKSPGQEASEENRKLVFEAEEWLEKTRQWESYSLDTRVGIKVTSGLDTTKRWKEKYVPS